MRASGLVRRAGGTWALCVMLWSGGGTPPAHAERGSPTNSGASDSDASALVLVTPDAARGRAAPLLEQFATRTGTRLRAVETAQLTGAAPEVAPSELTVLARAEEALLSARALSAELREAAALRVLAAAEQELLASLAVPGVHAFLAEIYLQFALCAAQLEEQGLFESALERALSLDPGRRLEAAEAPPAILARARALAQRREQAALSELRLQTDPPGARVWLDDLTVATGDGSIRARAGVHVLVVRAPGHAPYATLLTLAAGRRPNQRIALSPTAGELARRSLSQPGAAARRAQAASALSLAEGEPVYLVEVGPGAAPRGLLQRCDGRGCGAPIGLDQEGRAREEFSETPRARAWLQPHIAQDGDATRRLASEKPLWKRWPLWAGAAALVLAGAATAVWVARPDAGPPERSLEIDASALPR